MRVVYKNIGFLFPDPHIDLVISPIDLPQMSLTSVSLWATAIPPG